MTNDSAIGHGCSTSTFNACIYTNLLVSLNRSSSRSSPTPSASIRCRISARVARTVARRSLRRTNSAVCSSSRLISCSQLSSTAICTKWVGQKSESKTRKKDGISVQGRVSTKASEVRRRVHLELCVNICGSPR